MTSAPAIETLMNEHRLIEKVLASLETFVDEGGLAGADARQNVARYARFFREFADRIHHGKEEDRLFVKMNAHGFPKEFGPVAVMLAEHVEGRTHVGALHQIGAGSGPISGDERADVTRHAGAFIPLLRGHIQKEDNILYPMALQAIPPREMELLAEAFELFEREALGAVGADEYRQLAADLAAAFPPNEGKMLAAAGIGCGARSPS